MDSASKDIRSPVREKIAEHRNELHKSRRNLAYGKKAKGKIKIGKIVKIGIVSIIIIIVALVLFLKLDTQGAAIFTDNVLRPLLGDNRVIYLEKIFFNTSDLVDRLTQNQSKDQAPQFIGQGSATIPGGDLDLTSIPTNSAFTPLPNEGTWQNYPLSLFPSKEVMAYTFVRPDPARSFAIVTLVQMDKRVMDLGSVAGTQQPGGPVGKPGPGVIPKDIINSGKLIAAFDGGFQYKDGAYGMIVGDSTYLPLKNDLGTLVGYKDGSLKIVDYQGQSLGDNVAFVRQNCPMLITDGSVTVSDPKDRTLWGRLAAGTVGIYTWRSGIGITKNGNLLFAVGNNLTPETLADALQSAGAVNAIQLDINPVWVRFNIFEPIGNDKYSSTTLTKELHDGSWQYLNGYQKDFFYVYAK